MNENTRKWLNIVLVVVFAVSTLLMLRHWIQSGQADSAYEEAQQLAGLTKEEETAAETQPATQPEEITEPPTETVPPETEPQTVWVPAPVEEDRFMEELEKTDLAALREINPDVVGWIYGPSTQINYPIMHGEDNQFYLEHNWKKEKNVKGSIFLESTNSPDLKDFRSILYGHNMGDDSMFGVLDIYTNKSYWQKRQYVYLVTDEGVLRYEVYACYKADVESDTYALSQRTDEEKAAFIAMTIENSVLDTGIVPEVTDRILTMSTCVTSADLRLVVHARLPMIEVAVGE